MPYRQLHFERGLRGLAILRTGAIATDDELAAHMSALVGTLTETIGESRLIGGPERDVASGYSRWAATYDNPGNPLIAHEEPIVHEILATWPAPIRVLDAACGTGRHTGHLAALGHDVTGLDASPSMLARAAAKHPGVPLVEGRVDDLPFPPGDFDAAVCSLLFDHLLEIDPAIGELTRVVRPGGRVLISNIHPTMALVGAHANFRDTDGNPHFMRSNHHPVSAYVRSFRDHGLGIVRCEEPCWDIERARAQFPFVPDDLAYDAIVGLPMALVWEVERSA